MRAVVCVKPNAVSGTLNPFDECAYEAALRIPSAEVILLSMAPSRYRELLLSLTRLGAKEAYLLSDAAFAGADTLATTYTLSAALNRLRPDLVLCGRKTADGDTGQVGTGLAARMGYALVTEVMRIDEVSDGHVTCLTRGGDTVTVPFPALLTVERINTLRLPSIRSKVGRLTVWDAAALGAELSRCGTAGSPTRVIAACENTADRRFCRFIEPSALRDVLLEAQRNDRRREILPPRSEKRLGKVMTVGENLLAAAQSIAENVCELTDCHEEALLRRIRAEDPDAVLFDDSPNGKKLAARAATMLETGLCADCTGLETDEEYLTMIRPAFGGGTVAKIICLTRPALATVRTVSKNGADTVFCVGKGAGMMIERIRALAEINGASLAATRGAVDEGLLPYEAQVGLTGKTVSPAVYVAFGVSGAVHHIVGMRSSGTVIAVNPDKNAPIFDHADYGICADVKTVLDTWQA